MQNRYAGDIGDFAKFAILRALTSATDIRIGLVWYLTSQRADPAGDGRHTAYLARNKGNEDRYRSCDPELFDQIKLVAESDHRNVRAYSATDILPRETVYVDRPLIYDASSSRTQRAAFRDRWLRHAFADTADCDLVMFDPDNGLPVKSAGLYSSRGTKYVFFEELLPYVSRDQSIVVYQHADRSASITEQVRERLSQLQSHLPLTREPFALVWRSVSSRSFLVAPAERHDDTIRESVATLRSAPLARHLDFYP